MWKGRFQKETTDLVQQYGESISYDWRLYPYDVRGSIAHAEALAAAKIITRKEFIAIRNGLREIEADITAGNFEFKIALEDIHMNIESALTARIGDAGAKLHTARSRNDQVALDVRMYCREEVDNIIGLLKRMQKSLVQCALKNQSAVIPGYTHLQRGQPVLFAHHLLAYVEMFDRDCGRLTDARTRVNVMPLGSGALAGSTIPLDRNLIAEKLDFPAISQNSMDAVSDRDFVAEILFALALAGTHLSRLSEDVILWATAEFRFVTLSDAHTTGSSLMPQKKNPDVAELTRGRSGRLYGNLMSILTTLKGLPMTYNRDLQEDKEPLFDSIDTIKAALRVFAEMIDEMKVNEKETAAAADDPYLLATDVADWLVKHKVPFRRAHEIVGQLTAHCVENDRQYPELSLEDFQAFDSVFDESVFKVFDVQTALKARVTTGAPSPVNVARQLSKWQRKLARK